MKPAFAALVDVLAQVSSLVIQLSDQEYGTPGPAGVSGSIGKHVRHCLDHVAALERGLRTHRIDYDARVRGGDLESNRSAALAALAAMQDRLGALDDRWLDHLVQVTSQLSADGRRVVTHSTIGRELAFVISHTIHHNATIHVLLQQRHDRIPAGFGFAASTPCALSA